MANAKWRWTVGSRWSVNAAVLAISVAAGSSVAMAQSNADKDFERRAAAEKGARTLPSGLILKTLKAGKGEKPTAADKVTVNYEGTLTDGSVFDSSYQRGQPTSFPLGAVIPCWTEGVQQMKVGETARLVCPASIAYGERGHPPQIPGGATLVFKVELISIQR
jgi:FKBP-type peptidyl-prolyl cis-trans isomerase FkpA